MYVVLALVVGFGAGIGVAKGFLSPEPAEGTTAQSAAQAALAPSQPLARVTTPVEAAAPPTLSVQIATEGRPFLGPEDALVTIVEFSDYQCPFCGRHFQQTLPQLLREYEGRVRYVLMNYPISSIHSFAQKAGEAAECAYDQDRFWEYHDALFRNQEALDLDSLKRYAVDIGLDASLFSMCLDSGAKTELVLKDFQEGQSYGVTGTPTFFINGRRLIGARPFTSFKTMIDAALGG